MIGIVLVSHGRFAAELLRSAELIIGEQKDVATFGLEQGDSVDELRVAVRNAIRTLDDGSGVLVLTDLFGGSPSNVAAANMRDLSYYSLTGINLPMLIEALTMRDSLSIDKLVNYTLAAGIEGIKNIGEILNLVTV